MDARRWFELLDVVDADGDVDAARERIERDIAPPWEGRVGLVEDKTREGHRYPVGGIFRVNRAQFRYCYAQNENVLMCCGRGVGKSWIETLDVTIVQPFRFPGGNIRNFARTYAEGIELHQPMMDAHLDHFHRKTGVKLVESFKKDLKRWRYRINGKETNVYLRPWDRLEKTRYSTNALVAIDEAEHGANDSKLTYDTIHFTLRGAHPWPWPKQYKATTSPNGMIGLTSHFVDQLTRVTDGKPDPNPNYCLVTAAMVDNPFLHRRDIEAKREGTSKIMWLQEGEGRILRPTNTVFGHEYNEDRILIDWPWTPSEYGASWILIVDWGDPHGYAGCVMVTPAKTAYRYQWVLFDEFRMDPAVSGASDLLLQQKIEGFVKKYGLPAHAGVDRAIVDQKRWLKRRFPQVRVKGCESAAEQDVMRGIRWLKFMLDPPEGPPLFRIANHLDPGIKPEGRGARGSFLNFRWRLDQDDRPIANKPHKDNVNDHAIDAICYGVKTSSKFVELHGGDMLKCVYAEAMMPERAMA